MHLTDGEVLILVTLLAQTLAVGLFFGGLRTDVRELVRWKNENAGPMLEEHDRAIAVLKTTEA